MSGRSRSSGRRLVVEVALLLLLVAGAVRLEFLLLDLADEGPAWRQAVLLLLALLFVPALLLGAALALRMRRRNGGG